MIPSHGIDDLKNLSSAELNSAAIAAVGAIAVDSDQRRSDGVGHLTGQQDARSFVTFQIDGFRSTQVQEHIRQPEQQKVEEEKDLRMDDATSTEIYG